MAHLLVPLERGLFEARAVTGESMTGYREALLLEAQPDMLACGEDAQSGRLRLRNSLDRDHRNRSIAIAETDRWRSPKPVHRDRWSGQSGGDPLS